ncbi:MAG: threonine-phosphate decarboxylase CobD [Nitrospirales bacterium]|nr:threonine-phosphate decarboxylase [Nitrospira sp.]MDR4502245.1 threonine-phosphate decarboxylase CobD [Nitrospirales bacterium]
MSAEVLHGGQVHQASLKRGKALDKILDFSASINPLGLSLAVRRAIHGAVPSLVHYPDIEATVLRQTIAETYRISEDMILVGNGSAELISVLPRALGSQHGVIVGPTFMEFERALIVAGASCSYVHARRATQYRPPIDAACRQLSKARKRPSQHKTSRSGSLSPPVDMVYLCNPNSPTGQHCSRRQILQLLGMTEKANIYLVVDEAFIEFCARGSVLNEVKKYQRLIVLRSLTKFYAMPGIRVGFLAGSPGIVQRLAEYLPLWSVNTVAQVAARAALVDETFRVRSREFMKRERKRFSQRLTHLPNVRVYPSVANFVMVELSSYEQVRVIKAGLLERGILIRDCQNFSGIKAPTIRLAVRKPRDNDRLIKALHSLLI